MNGSLSIVLTVWYVVTAGCLVYLLWDLVRNSPAGKVMKLAWVLVVAYTGPVGLALYWFSCREPAPGTHDEFIKPHWKQATGSLLHCVAGDATGIIISAAIVYHFRLPNGVDLIFEYVSAFIVGLLVFQALFMLKMYNGDYWMAVRKTFFAETVSMNMVMLGMFPVMLLLMHRLPDADNPFHVTFWGVMSLATMAGMVTAYPINSWMVARGLKHGMMSAKPSPKTGAEMPDAKHGEMEMPMPRQAGMDHADMQMDSPTKMDGGMDMPMEEAASHGEHADHKPPSLPKGLAVALIAGTFALLGLAIWITSWFVTITFVRDAVS